MSQDASIQFPAASIARLSQGAANADLSATGPGFLKQDTLGAAVRVASPYEIFQSGKNALINGNFDIWQAGTSQVNAYGYLADMWILDLDLDCTQAQVADRPTVSASVPYSNYSFKITVTTAQTPLSSYDYAQIFQYIEGYNWQRLWQRQLTLSFWVKGSVTGTYCVSLVSSGLDRSYVATYTINVASTWEYKTITIAPSPSGGSWDFTVNGAAALAFCLGAGTDYQTTAGSWQTGWYLATSAQTNLFAVNGSTWQVAQVQLEVGAYATPFQMRQFATELALCKRYYEVLNDGMLGVGMNTNVAGAYILIKYEVAKRGLPSIGHGAASNFQAAAANGTGITCTNINFQNIGTITARMTISVASGLVVGNANYVYLTNPAGAVTIDARL